MSPKEWTLLVLAAAGKPVSPVQLQKSLFLLSENIASEQLGLQFYKFAAYDYGPFCQQVYSDAEALQEQGTVVITFPGRRYRQYSATPAGADVARGLRNSLDDSTRDYLDKMVGWVMARSFNELVRAIYQRYPEMKANSVFQEPDDTRSRN